MTGRKPIRVVASGGLGDSLLLTAFLPTLADRAGDAGLTVVTTPDRPALFDTNPHVTRVQCVEPAQLPLHAVPDPRWEIFSPWMAADVVHERGRMRVSVRYPMKANLRSVPVIEQIAAVTGVPAATSGPVLHLTAEDRADAQDLLDAAGLAEGTPFLVVAPGTGPGTEKQWPADCWRQACGRLGAHWPLLLLGDDAGLELAGVIHLDRPPAIRTSAAVLARSAGFLSVDTFLPHLAAAVGVRGAVLFGPSDEVAFGHAGNLNLHTDVPCRPCGDTARRRACRDNVCMQGYDAPVVAERVLRWLTGC